jgi:tetratricopeptide (TPR) repeat protein
MKTRGLLRALFSITILSAVLSFTLINVFGQDVGADIGGGAGIFRPKNPEAKKKATKPGTKTSNRATGRGRVSAATEERVEELLDTGNTARDDRRFVEAEAAYEGVLKLKPRDSRAAYGLGNVYSDQQLWQEAEAHYRNSVLWAPNDVDAYVALSVVLVQPVSGGDNAKRLADAEHFARRAVQIDPKNAGIAWGLLVRQEDS